MISFGDSEASFAAAAAEDTAAAHAEPEAVEDEVDAGFAAHTSPAAAKVGTGSALEDAKFCKPDCMLIFKDVELGEDIELPS